MFGLHLVSKGLLVPELSKILAKEKEDRELSDYDVLTEMDRARAEERLHQAREFVGQVRATVVSRLGR